SAPAQRPNASGIRPHRIVAVRGSGRRAQLIDNETKYASVSQTGTPKRPKSFSPRAGFQHATAEASDEPQWLSSKNDARLLDTTVGAIRNMVWRGHLTVFRLPNGRLRFKKSELDRQLESSRKQGGFNGC